MLNYKGLCILLSLIVLFLLVGPEGCSPDPTAAEIIKNSLTNMENVNTYQLNTDVTWTLGSTEKEISNKNNMTINWKGNRSVSISDKALHKTINMEISDAAGGKTHWTVETYLASDYAYTKVNSDMGQSNTFNVWQISESSDDRWAAENQIAELIGLIKTSNSTTLSGNENLNGTDCFILNILPTNAAVADWVTSQFQGYGASDLSLAHTSIGGRDDYLKYFRTGAFKIWVSKNNYLVIKADFSPHFEATPQDLNLGQNFPDVDKLTSDFHGQLQFSAYNSPVSVQPPTPNTTDVRPSTSATGSTSPTPIVPTSLGSTNYPTATVRDVPAPAPVPWSNISTYTEQTYHIEATAGMKFAIGMFATGEWRFSESNDHTFLTVVDDQMVKYQDSSLNKYGTEWFLFEPIKAGNTEIIFQYPLEYTKLFTISIK